MKKLLFIDHVFHKKTRSSDFFIDVLKKRFDVTIIYLAPNERLEYSILDAAATHDIVLLWQIDFLAPVFSALGKAVIVIPMYDGSSSMPDLHWLLASNARFVNFSLALHERVRLLGGASKLVRYFPEPIPESKLPNFRTLSAFLWQRRPEHGVTFELIAKLIGHDLDRFHVHNVPDIPGTHIIQQPAGTTFELSESAWFPNKGGYTAELAKANVFIAPRVAEGIGMALLEAMAHGMLVLAHDLPTNNEYICSWVNGILFNKDLAPTPISIRYEAERLALMGWQTVALGHEAWLQSHDAILDWIDGAPVREPVAINAKELLRDLWFNYYNSLAAYEGFLRRQMFRLGEIAGVPLETLVKTVGQETPAKLPQVSQIRWDDLPENGIVDIVGLEDRFVGSGWSASEGEWRWAVGVRSEVRFGMAEVPTGRASLSFPARSLPDLGEQLHCIIELNDDVVFVGEVSPIWRTYRVEFDASAFQERNIIRLSFENASSTPMDERYLSVCFRRFEFRFVETALESHTDLPANLGRDRTTVSANMRD